MFDLIMSCDSLELLFQISFVFSPSLNFYTCTQYAAYRKALEDAIAALDEVAFEIDVTDRKFHFCSRLCKGITYALSRQILQLHLEVSLTDSSEPDCFLTHEFDSTGQMMLNIVRSCIGTKFTSRFGTLIAVRWLFLYYLLPSS